MKKVTKGIFMLALCILAWRGVNMAGNGGNEKTVIDKSLSKEEWTDYDRNKSFSFYVDQGKANDICYISYHTEVRRGGGGRRKVTVVRIIGR